MEGRSSNTADYPRWFDDRTCGHEAIRQAQNLGNQLIAQVRNTILASIILTPTGVSHVRNRHFPGGVHSAGKSLFNASEKLDDLINAAQGVTRYRQQNGNYRRVINAGRIIGIDRDTGKPTPFYTVITNAADELITAFPGLP